MKKIKLAVILVLSVLALEACEKDYTNYEEVNEQKVEVQGEKSLADKIKSKQKYIVVYKSFSGAPSGEELSNFIETTSQDMFSKNYELKQQNLSFTDIGYFKKVILTFEYRGD